VDSNLAWTRIQSSSGSVKQLTGYLRLMRPANIVTAIADVLAGFTIANALDLFSATDSSSLVFLIISTAFLYGGGVVLNDVFDAELDKIERPERPIPSGLIKKSSAAIFGTLLLLIGIASAFLAGVTPGFIALAIAIAAVVYDKWNKHHPFFGPLNMGICRGLNLILGMSIDNETVLLFWRFALVPVIYIFAITMISRGEVHGGSKKTLYVAAILYTLVIFTILAASLLDENLILTFPLILLFAIMIFRPLGKAMSHPDGPSIGKAVKAGVLSLIIMDASWAAATGNWQFALIILALLPLSILLAKLFAVT
jgi:4-hydroxybenzoate polyprenyltransferase